MVEPLVENKVHEIHSKVDFALDVKKLFFLVNNSLPWPSAGVSKIGPG
jgi:hypothetical protein